MSNVMYFDLVPSCRASNDCTGSESVARARGSFIADQATGRAWPAVFGSEVMQV